MKYYIVFFKEGVVVDVSSYSESEYDDYMTKLTYTQIAINEDPAYCLVRNGYDSIQSLTA